MPRRAPILATLACSAVVLAGCFADDPDAAPQTSTTRGGTADSLPVPDGLPTGGFGESRLTFFSDCPDLLGYLQAKALQRVTAWGLGGGPVWGPFPRPMGDMAGAVPQTTAAGSNGGESAAPPTMVEGVDYSGTNTQEVGVDEGDVVETNGTHVFAASQDGVRIVEVAAARVVATLAVAAGSHELLLDGDRLVVVTRPMNQWQETVVSVFDVGDPTAPKVLGRHHLEGSLTASRSADGIVRVVLTSELATRLQFVTPNQFGLDEKRALAENQRIIRESTIDQWMPRAFREGTDGVYGDIDVALDCSTVAAPRDFAGLGITWIASIDLDSEGGDALVAGAGVVSQGGTVHATADRLYLATTTWPEQLAPTGSTPEVAPVAADTSTLVIHRFTLTDDGGARYDASGTLNGRLLNQFAMSEYEGDLRVATTVESWSGTRPSESFVHVLRPEGTTLVPIGSVGGLGLTEQIYAVRFIGTQAYVVTFRQVDPLYVIDRADPTAPRLAGELKIPGYSAYLHPVGEGLLLGVGQDATADGVTLGTQLSLFDVRDPANPVRLSTLMIGGSSEAEWDHRAFLFWPADGTIVIPVSPTWGPCPVGIVCAADGIASPVGAGPVGAVVVAQLQGTSLVAKGTIQHSADASPCWAPLQRSMVIGDELATVGLDQVQFTDRDTLVVRGAARWSPADQYGCYYYGIG
jgi:hypothetical protein